MADTQPAAFLECSQGSVGIEKLPCNLWVLWRCAGVVRGFEWYSYSMDQYDQYGTNDIKWLWNVRWRDDCTVCPPQGLELILCNQNTALPGSIWQLRKGHRMHSLRDTGILDFKMAWSRTAEDRPYVIQHAKAGPCQTQHTQKTQTHVQHVFSSLFLLEQVVSQTNQVWQTHFEARAAQGPVVWAVLGINVSCVGLIEWCLAASYGLMQTYAYANPGNDFLEQTAPWSRKVDTIEQHVEAHALSDLYGPLPMRPR